MIGLELLDALKQCDLKQTKKVEGKFSVCRKTCDFFVLFFSPPEFGNGGISAQEFAEGCASVCQENNVTGWLC